MNEKYNDSELRIWIVIIGILIAIFIVLQVDFYRSQMAVNDSFEDRIATLEINVHQLQLDGKSQD